MSNTLIHKTPERGQWFFSMMSHNFYDSAVYKLVIPYIWRSSADRVIQSYECNLSDRHLEIGVGTGYALQHGLVTRTKQELNSLKLNLMDLNANCLHKAAHRLEHYQPCLHEHSVLEPFESTVEPFDSVAMHFVTHCLPGDFIAKGRAFKHIASITKPGGTFFGATVLGSDTRLGEHSGIAKVALWILNAVGIFQNRRDTLTDLRSELEDSFDFVEIEIIGSIAHWRAVK